MMFSTMAACTTPHAPCNRSPEFAEPADRLAAFGNLRDRQAGVLSGLAAHWARAGAVTPPHLSAKKVAGWTADATALDAAWARVSSGSGWCKAVG